MGEKHEIKWGKWQPWGMDKTMILPKVRNPIALRNPKLGWRTTKDYKDKWVGFDIQKYDFIAPWGKGKFADFEIRFEWDGKTYQNYQGSSQKIRFTEKFAGAYWRDKFPGSELKGIYFADPGETYMTEFNFFDWKKYDNKGRFLKWDQNSYDESKVLVGRSRCKVNDAGELESAIYFQITHLSFACDEEGVAIRCIPYYNPVPNDINIEPK